MHNENNGNIKEKILTSAEMGEGIRRIREKHKLSPGTVAAEAGYTIVQYTWIEEGLVSISGKELYRIMEAIFINKVPTRSLFERKLARIRFKVIYWLVGKQSDLEERFPVLQPLFDTTQLRHFLEPVLRMLTLLMLFHVFAYEIGYGLGKVYRWIDSLIN